MTYRLRPSEPTEAAIQKAVLLTLAYHPKVARAWRQNSGQGMLTRGRGGPRTTSQWIIFGFKGQPDICGFLRDGRALFVETKRPSTKPTPEQEEFLTFAAANGAVAFVARRVEDVLEALA